jgi:hypothetical protein
MVQREKQLDMGKGGTLSLKEGHGKHKNFQLFKILPGQARGKSISAVLEHLGTREVSP